MKLNSSFFDLDCNYYWQYVFSYSLNYTVNLLIFILGLFLSAIYIYKSEVPSNNNANNNNNPNNNNPNNNNNNNNNGNSSHIRRILTPPIYTMFDRARAYDNMRVRFTVSPRDELIVREDLQFRALASTNDGLMARHILSTVNLTRPYHIQRSVLGSHIRTYQVWPNERLYVELGFTNHGTWTGRPNIVVSDGINNVLNK